MAHTPEVLFVCVHNAGRSQMATALLQHHALGRNAIRSAGSEPAEKVNPASAEALAVEPRHHRRAPHQAVHGRRRGSRRRDDIDRRVRGLLSELLAR